MSGQNRARRLLTVVVLLRLARSYRHHGEVMYQGDQIANTIKEFALSLKDEQFTVDRSLRKILGRMHDDEEMSKVIERMFDILIEERND